jgi:hypothetical protein
MRHALLAGLMLIGDAALSWAAPGDPIGPEFQVNTYTTGIQNRPVVGPIAGGGFVVVWRSNEGDGTDTQGGNIQAQRYDAVGVPVGSQLQINTYTTSEQGSPKVAPRGNGGLVVVWESSGSGGTDTSVQSVQGQLLDAAGVPVGGEFQINTYTTGDQYGPGVSPAGDGGFLVVWNSYGGFGTDTDSAGIQAQRYDASGAPLGGQFQVNTYTTDGQYDAAVGPDGAGGFVVAWTSKFGDGTDTSVRSVQARRFDGGGAPIGGQFQVNSYTTNAQGYPVVTSMGAGGFVVVWLSQGSAGADTSQSSVHAQRFDAAGSPIGGEFEVNTYTTGTQRTHTVGTDGAGGFVVLWASYDGTGTDTDALSAQARRFDATGAPLGGDFQVNSYTTSDQLAYAVSPAGAGDFVVVWAGRGGGNDTDHSVQAQRFEGPEVVTTTTSSVPGATTTTTTTPPFTGERLTGQKLELRTKGGRADRARLAMRSGDPGLTLGRGNGSADDPVANGGALTVFSGGSAVRHELAGGWRYVGRAGRNKGYEWKSKSSPIRAIVIRPGRVVKVAGRGAIGFDLADDPRPIRLELAIGGHLYCFEFGGRLVDIRLNGRLVATQAPAPATCP